MKSTTSERLKEIMKYYNLRQIDILKRAEPYCIQYNIKMGRNDISQYVSGKVVPGQEKLTILSLALGVSETWLMGYDVPMERNVLKFDNQVDDTPYNRALQKLQNKEELSEDELSAIKEEFPKVLNITKKTFENIYNTIDDVNKNRLISSYEALNANGKIEAIKRVEELIYIPKYRKETPEYLQPVAAHNDYADDEEEQRLMKEDLDDL